MSFINLITPGKNRTQDTSEGRRGPVFTGGNPEDFIEKIIRSAVTESPDPELISQDDARRLPKQYNKAWNFSFYGIPEIIKDGKVYYNINTAKRAIAVEHDREEESRTLGCNNTCDYAAGDPVSKGGKVYCKNGILDVREAAAARIGNDYLFDMGHGKQKTEEFRKGFYYQEGGYFIYNNDMQSQNPQKANPASASGYDGCENEGWAGKDTLKPAVRVATPVSTRGCETDWL